MKIINLSLTAVISACLITPTLSFADNFEDALQEANISIDKAKAANYEWRDSRKLLKQAAKLKKEGNSDKAMTLIAKAKKQGELALAQAELQAGVEGPH